MTKRSKIYVISNFSGGVVDSNIEHHKAYDHARGYARDDNADAWPEQLQHCLLDLRRFRGVVWSDFLPRKRPILPFRSMYVNHWRSSCQNPTAIANHRWQ